MFTGVVEEGGIISPSWARKPAYFGYGSGLVRLLAICLAVGTYSIRTVPSAACSRQ